MKTAILIVAHGSRNPKAEEEFLQIVAELRQYLDYPILQHAWLEINQPDIATGLNLCREQGADKIVLMPYFLNYGNHVLRDIPAIVEGWQIENPVIPVVMTKHLSVSQKLLELVGERISETMNDVGMKDE